MESIVFNEVDGIEYDPLYNEILFTLAEYDNSIDPLNSENVSQQINWGDIREKSERLINVCKDLRVIMWFIRAGLHLYGIMALYQGIKLIDDALTNEEMIYPQIPGEPAGNSHAAAMGWLATPQCITDIRSSWLSPEIRLRLDELQNSDNDLGEQTLSFSEIIMTLQNANVYYEQQHAPELLAQLTFIVDSLERIENYANQYSDSYRLDCRNVRALLRKIANQLTSLNIENVDLDESEYMATGENTTNVATGSDIQKYDGKIRTRQEAILMLDKIIEYFKTHEPSHPAPIFIRRSQKMIGMEFEAIVEELMPDAMGSLQQFIGK